MRVPKVLTLNHDNVVRNPIDNKSKRCTKKKLTRDNSQQQINKSRSQLTIEALPTPKSEEWKLPEIVVGPATKPNKDRTMPQISLSLIPVSGLKENTPIKTMSLDQNWKQSEEYNALDKMKDFAEKAAFDLPKRPNDKYFDFTLVKTPDKSKPEKENNLEKLIESYSRISEFINGCNWSKLDDPKRDPKSLEQKYLDAKNEFMTQNLMLMPKDTQASVLKDVIDLSNEDDILTDIITKKIGKGTFNVGKDGALSISVQPMGKDVSPVRFGVTTNFSGLTNTSLSRGISLTYNIFTVLWFSRVAD